MTGTGDLTRFALDTNILVYVEAFERVPSDKAKVERASALIDLFTDVGAKPVIALQTLAELHRVLARKRGLSAPQATAAIAPWRRLGDVVETSHDIFDAALQLASDHLLSIYDAIIFACAVHARCDLLLSEDMQDGFAWRGVTIANPFAAKLEPRLAKLLA